MFSEGGLLGPCLQATVQEPMPLVKGKHGQSDLTNTGQQECGEFPGGVSVCPLFHRPQTHLSIS